MIESGVVVVGILLMWWVFATEDMKIKADGFRKAGLI